MLERYFAKISKNAADLSIPTGVFGVMMLTSGGRPVKNAMSDAKMRHKR